MPGKTEHTYPMTLEAPFGILKEVPCSFDIEVEEYPAEPYSWGQSRGTEKTVSAVLSYVTLNNLTLSGQEIEQWLGPEAVDRLETAALDTYTAEQD